MIGLGLSAVDLVALNTRLTTSHRIAIVAQILDLNHNRLSDVSTFFLDGQVTYDWTADITRSANLTFLDPTHSMSLDSGSPAQGALYMDRMMAIYYVVMNYDGSNPIAIPVMTGPITKVDRDFAVVQVECQGKEVLSQGQVWTPKTYKMGMNKVALIKDVLSTLSGETKFSLPAGTTARITSNLAISNDSKPWEIATAIAHSMGYILFYDGRGTCVMRPWTAAPKFTFRDFGDGAAILSKPKIGYDLSKVINATQVKGVLVKGKSKVPFVVKRYAPRTHPLSPWNIGRGGVPRFLWDTIEDDSINSVAEANAVGDARITRGLIETITASFDALPIPHLELLDVYSLETSEYITTSSIYQMTLPLTVGSTATIGYLKYVQPNTKVIRRNVR